MIKISVCIPVYNTEQYLIRCLESVVQAAADFTDYEILVCNDGSPGKGCKEICAETQVKYIEHKENKGLLEARRSLVLHASGEYILMLDSDDELMPDIFNKAYLVAKTSDADIIQFSFKMYSAHKAGRIYLVPDDTYITDDIIKNYMLCNVNGFIWGKLYKRVLYQNVLQQIPNIFITYGEDVLQSFLLMKNAKKLYSNSEIILYTYNTSTGISHTDPGDNTQRWKQICSAGNMLRILESQCSNQSELSFAQGTKSRYAYKHIRLLQGVSSSKYNGIYNMVCATYGKNTVDALLKTFKIKTPVL